MQSIAQWWNANEQQVYTPAHLDKEHKSEHKYIRQEAVNYDGKLLS